MSPKWNNPKDPLAGYGYYVILVHEKNGVNYYSLYSHLLNPDTKDFPSECKMTPGESVKAGECVGISDATGHAIPSGFPHMHFAMWSGTAPFSNTYPIAPETSKGLKLYGTLAPHTKVTTMATATIDNPILPSLTLKLNETQQRDFVFTNTSKVDWDQKNKFELVRISGTSTGAPEKVALTQIVKTRELATVILNIKGTTPGVFESEWQLHHNGVAFGPIVTLRYTVGVNPDDISNLPASLWQLIKPRIMKWLEDQINQYINQLLQDLLNNIYQLCGIVPLGTIGIFFGAVIAKQRQPSWKLKWSGQGSWFSVIQSAVGMFIIFLLSALLLVIGRELIWWSGVIKNTGVIVLALSGLLILWGVIRSIKWIKDTGLKRLISIFLLILIPITYFHGQRYRTDEPITTRYFYSISDVTFIAKDNLENFWKDSVKFTNELVILLRE